MKQRVINPDNSSDKAIIFDFDGTLADSFALAVEIFYKLTSFKKIPKADISRLRGLPVAKVAHELGIPLWRVPTLLSWGRKQMYERSDEIEMFEGMPDTLKQLSKTHKIFILSSNSPKTIAAVLKKYKVDHTVQTVYGGISLFSKHHKLKQVVKQQKLDATKVWYVGDEARDIEAANKEQIKSIAVSWGYNNIHVLKSHQPDHLVFTTNELVQCIKHNK